MFCRRCGKNLPDKSTFCSGCGTKVEVVSGMNISVKASKYQLLNELRNNAWLFIFPILYFIWHLINQNLIGIYMSFNVFYIIDSIIYGLCIGGMVVSCIKSSRLFILIYSCVFCFYPFYFFVSRFFSYTQNYYSSLINLIFQSRLFLSAVLLCLVIYALSRKLNKSRFNGIIELLVLTCIAIIIEYVFSILINVVLLNNQYNFIMILYALINIFNCMLDSLLIYLIYYYINKRCKVGW